MLKFTKDDLTPQEEPVEIGELKLILREASGKAQSAYQSAAIRGSRVAKSGGEITIGDDIGDADLVLLAGCLFYPNNRSVPRSIIEGWNGRISKAIAKRAKQMSGLDDAEEDPAKIREEIERLQKRLEELESDALGESSGENTDGSGSPTN